MPQKGVVRLQRSPASPPIGDHPPISIPFSLHLLPIVISPSIIHFLSLCIGPGCLHSLIPLHPCQHTAPRRRPSPPPDDTSLLLASAWQGQVSCGKAGRHHRLAAASATHCQRVASRDTSAPFNPLLAPTTGPGTHRTHWATPPWSCLALPVFLH